ncbi:MAG: transposase [Mediterranea sp.]|nr:transposase [Mediterranea sp.]
MLADKIYCTRENRALLKKKGIELVAKPLGRPSAVTVHVSPGERNPIEGKFGRGRRLTAWAVSARDWWPPPNLGLPASYWCLTWSSWPGRQPCALWRGRVKVFQPSPDTQSRKYLPA